MGAITYAEDMKRDKGYDKQEQDRGRLTQWVLKFLLLVTTVAVIVAFLVLVDFEKTDFDNSVGPQQAFEDHLLALDEQQWELADTFVVARCQTDNAEAREAAGQDLKRMGFSFSRAFVVDEVWFNADERTVLLGLTTPANLLLPGVASMERVDGDWLISCS